MAVATTDTYEAFGLTVQSEIDLPELSPADLGGPTDPDVTVTERAVTRPPALTSEKSFHAAGQRDYYLKYDAATVRVRGGTRIAIDPASGAPHEVLRHVIVGPALNHLLHQRGYFVLHASTVAIDGAAVAFVGESGQGKTTTALACLTDGHRVLSDDVAAITLGDDGPVVRSGYPAVKLSTEAVETFDPPVDPPVRTYDGRPRHFHRLRHDQPESPVPLAGVYLLEDGPEIAVESLSGSERVMSLVDNTYAIGTLGFGRQAATNVGVCGEIAGSTSVKRLRRPRELGRLPEVIDRVRADLAGERC
ncbi:hypothetical protein ACOZ4I_04135 [Haloarcula salina]|uniref:hypothetical protein n=1 Tax=Haloarcula salina TaxID=1429914 RepID=UPI003C6FC9F9